MSFECSRCGTTEGKFHALDDPINPEVCDDCLKPWDEVLDLP